jgi:DNA-directed RNA polymerase specialized sigma24 family protein
MPTRGPHRPVEPQARTAASRDVDTDQRSDRFGGLVASLTRHERLLLCLRYADGLADDEISVLTRMPVPDVRQAIEHIVTRARAFMSLAADAT